MDWSSKILHWHSRQQHISNTSLQ